MPIAKSEMVDHLEQMKGTYATAKQAGDNGDFNRLQQME